MPWSVCNILCAEQAHGMTMLTVQDQADMDFIWGQLEDATWLGYSKTGDAWQWSSSADSYYLALWSYAEPDASNAFAAVKPSNLGRWSTLSGADEAACACEYNEWTAPTPSPTEVCPAGTYNSGQGMCLDCDAGTFTSAPGRTECSECAAVLGPGVS